MTQTTTQDRQRNTHGKLDCPDPGCERVGQRGFDGPQGLGSHLKTAHGIAGSSASTLAARRAKDRARSEPNTWGKHNCPERHCDRKGQNGLPTPQALGRHLQAMHGQPGSGPEAKRRRRRGAEPGTLARMDHHQGNGSHSREHSKIHVAVESLPSPAHADPLHYCPGCGFDLDAAKQHLHPSVRANAYIRCPQCRTNLAVVSAVLRPDIQAIQPEHAMALVEAARRVSSVI
ncbi:MAG: hypothetical protein ACM359_17490 [Bacillota bacterium]